MPIKETRYYYKSKDGKVTYSLREPLNESELAKYDEITEEEWNALQPKHKEPTAAQLAARNKKVEINQLKRKLAETDYVVIKIAEGVATAEEYVDVISQRATWRARINDLEEDL